MHHRPWAGRADAHIVEIRRGKNVGVRTRVTKKAWFGPKRYRGWGWRISSWQGGVASALLVVAVAVAALVWRGSSLVPIAVLLLIYVAVVLLTGDPPGGPSREGGGRGI